MDILVDRRLVACDRQHDCAMLSQLFQAMVNLKVFYLQITAPQYPYTFSSYLGIIYLFLHL